MRSAILAGRDKQSHSPLSEGLAQFARPKLRALPARSKEHRPGVTGKGHDATTSGTVVVTGRSASILRMLRTSDRVQIGAQNAPGTMASGLPARGLPKRRKCRSGISPKRKSVCAGRSRRCGAADPVAIAARFIMALVRMGSAAVFSKAPFWTNHLHSDIVYTDSGCHPRWVILFREQMA